MDCNENSIIIENDLVKNIDNNETVEFGELIQFLYQNAISTIADGWWHTPKLEYDAETGQGEAYFTYSYATHIAKVRVDKLTGLVKVEKVWVAHDVGKAINPAGIEAQVEGGVAQGIGYALTENFKIHNGKVLTDNLSTYLVPTALDISDVETIIVEDPEPLGPWGAKGIGEPAIIPTAAAIANAVSNAIGKQVNAIPISPEKVLELI